ncbi:hypothetical protein FOMPIDRAFT_1026665 [Fomitopsis schrenkii]|uniref:THIF-type NAD/FAD binding fold domain-containing protein n=1 Tax=Fomitopsis schrenkii TaxID=2126942 RepID=S8DJF8_FOMSC|nr:hypothetical protein FOMPIDRAFT_1026665 [Fomitopsis schrenkii]
MQRKLGPRVAGLTQVMDPLRLTSHGAGGGPEPVIWSSSVDASRPGLSLIKSQITRTLMGWGVRTITIVDSSRVSFSNPVRELLFELNGRKPKAACAAELLKRFFLRVNATKRSLSVPIPYRPISRASVAQANADVTALEALFDTLDAIFLLMESCESRWLLTALGFDMFAVMCCGAHSTEAKGERLSGYYCDDIVTPTDTQL